jgi:hypothetical protein
MDLLLVSRSTVLCKTDTRASILLLVDIRTRTVRTVNEYWLKGAHTNHSSYGAIQQEDDGIHRQQKELKGRWIRKIRRNHRRRRGDNDGRESEEVEIAEEEVMKRAKKPKRP